MTHAKDLPDFSAEIQAGPYAATYHRHAWGGRLTLTRKGAVLIDSQWSDRAEAHEWDFARRLHGSALTAAMAAESRRRLIDALADEVDYALDPDNLPDDDDAEARRDAENAARGALYFLTLLAKG